MDEEQIIRSRLKDLADRAYRQGTYTYSNFLAPAELSLIDDIKSDIGYIDFKTSGEGGCCDRQMVCFGSEDMFGYKESFPISIIKVQPVIDKFSDELNHRDFLGAVMNLGIERNMIGDIVVREGKKAYIYCNESISGYICDNLTKIKHTNVKCCILDSSAETAELKPEFKDISVVVASDRFDAVAACVTKLSRSETLNLFKSKKVTLNGRLCEKNSISLKENDTFSLRGYGKYIYCGCGNVTRKGKIYVYLKQYI